MVGQSQRQPLNIKPVFLAHAATSGAQRAPRGASVPPIQTACQPAPSAPCTSEASESPTSTTSSGRSASPVASRASLSAWSKSVKETETFVSSITLYEIERGIVQVGRRDARQGEALRRWFEGRVLELYEGRVLDFDAAAASTCARLQNIRTLPVQDGMIAAIAAANRLTLVTRHTRDFAGLGVSLINPWTYTP